MLIFKLLWGGHLGFRRMPQINSVRGLSDIKAISKYEVNLTSGFQNIAFTSNCERTDRQGHTIIQAYKKVKIENAILRPKKINQ